MGTLIDEADHAVEYRVTGDQLWLEADALEPATGWVLKPEGLCRGEVCVPVRDRAALVPEDGWIDLAALESLEAPDATLPGLDGSSHHLSEWSHRKRAIVAWASWCGCRYELPAWQILREDCLLYTSPSPRD